MRTCKVFFERNQEMLDFAALNPSVVQLIFMKLLLQSKFGSGEIFSSIIFELVKAFLFIFRASLLAAPSSFFSFFFPILREGIQTQALCQENAAVPKGDSYVMSFTILLFYLLFCFFTLLQVYHKPLQHMTNQVLGSIKVEGVILLFWLGQIIYDVDTQAKAKQHNYMAQKQKFHKRNSVQVVIHYNLLSKVDQQQQQQQKQKNASYISNKTLGNFTQNWKQE